MAGELPDWGHGRRRLPAHLMAEGAANPGGSVAEIDGIMVTNPDGRDRHRSGLWVHERGRARASGKVPLGVQVPIRPQAALSAVQRVDEGYPVDEAAALARGALQVERRYPDEPALPCHACSRDAATCRKSVGSGLSTGGFGPPIHSILAAQKARPHQSLIHSARDLATGSISASANTSPSRTASSAVQTRSRSPGSIGAPAHGEGSCPSVTSPAGRRRCDRTIRAGPRATELGRAGRPAAAWPRRRR